MSNSISEAFWIFEPNLVSTLLILSQLGAYDFDNSDLDAIKYGLAGTSNKKEINLNYSFGNTDKIDLSFARDEDNPDIIFIKVKSDEKFSKEIKLAIFVLQEFNVTSSRFPSEIHSPS